MHIRSESFPSWELCGSCVRGLPVDMHGRGVHMYPRCPGLAGDAHESCDILSDALESNEKERRGPGVTPTTARM